MRARDCRGGAWLAHERDQREPEDEPVSLPVRPASPLIERLSPASLAAVAEVMRCSVEELIERARPSGRLRSWG